MNFERKRHVEMCVNVKKMIQYVSIYNQSTLNLLFTMFFFILLFYKNELYFTPYQMNK